MRRTSLVLASLFTAATVAAQNRIPLNDLGRGMYLGQYEGGLYENGSNVMPSDHAAAGMVQAALVRPLDARGNPSPSGKIVMISIGMSNTTQEFCAAGNPAPCTPWSFVGQALADPAVNHSTLLFVNGARGGQTSDTWASSNAANYDYLRDHDLIPAGVTEAQVQVAWLKEANAQPRVSLPAADADAIRLESQIGSIVRAMNVRYPNLRLVYISSRIYAGYATTALNPEPYAYETGLAVKWAVQEQIDQRRRGALDETLTPWIAWGPYLWTSGMSARSDGLTWSRNDVESDGTHPSQSGEQKVGALLLSFLKQEPTARPWFLATPSTRRRAVR